MIIAEPIRINKTTVAIRPVQERTLQSSFDGEGIANSERVTIIENGAVRRFVTYITFVMFHPVFQKSSTISPVVITKSQSTIVKKATVTR